MNQVYSTQKWTLRHILPVMKGWVNTHADLHTHKYIHNLAKFPLNDIKLYVRA